MLEYFYLIQSQILLFLDFFARIFNWNGRLFYFKKRFKLVQLFEVFSQSVLLLIKVALWIFFFNVVPIIIKLYLNLVNTHLDSRISSLLFLALLLRHLTVSTSQNENVGRKMKIWIFERRRLNRFLQRN